MVVPSHALLPGDKLSLRRLARERRAAFVQSLDRDARAAAELRLANILDPLLQNSRITGGYCPMPVEISPLPALERAESRGTTIAFPTFADRNSDFRFHAGELHEEGPWGVFQPALNAPVVYPDLVLLPLVAIDRHGTRLGQGKGHYDRVVGMLRERGALLMGLGWQVQLLDETIPTDPWDVALDGFASPEGLEMFR
jgi:5-formyltetrahydrofolate cyclo-ligase